MTRTPKTPSATPASSGQDEEAFLEYAFDGVIAATDKYGVNTPGLDKAIDEAKAALAQHMKEAVKRAERALFEETARHLSNLSYAVGYTNGHQYLVGERDRCKERLERLDTALASAAQEKQKDE